MAWNIAAVIGATDRQDGYLQGNGYMVIGHLVSFADAVLYGKRFKKWRYGDLPIIPKIWHVLNSAKESDHHIYSRSRIHKAMLFRAGILPDCSSNIYLYWANHFKPERKYYIDFIQQASKQSLRERDKALAHFGVG